MKPNPPHKQTAQAALFDLPLDLHRLDFIPEPGLDTTRAKREAAMRRAQEKHRGTV